MLWFIVFVVALAFFGRVWFVAAEVLSERELKRQKRALRRIRRIVGANDRSHTIRYI